MTKNKQEQELIKLFEQLKLEFNSFIKTPNAKLEFYYEQLQTYTTKVLRELNENLDKALDKFEQNLRSKDK